MQFSQNHFEVFRNFVQLLIMINDELWSEIKL